MAQRFTDRVAVVTGAGGGIGEAYARALHAEGASVVIAELNEDAGAAVAADLGDRALFVRTDVGELASCEAMAARAIEAFGESTISSTTRRSSATWKGSGSPRPTRPMSSGSCGSTSWAPPTAPVR